MLFSAVEIRNATDCEHNTITYIDISGRDLSDDMYDIIYQFVNLKVLTICDGGDVYIPNTISKLEELEELYFVNVNVAAVSDEITKLRNLRIISFKGSHMKFIPNIITHIPNLKYLYINEKNMTMLPSSIGGLTKLKGLRLTNLEWNVPNEIAELQKLRSIDYYAEDVRYPDGMFEIQNTYVHNNKMLITKLTSDIIIPTNITHLNILKYAGGNLDNLPSLLEHLKIRRLFRPLLNLPTSLKSLEITWIPLCEDNPYEIKLPYACKLKTITFDEIAAAKNHKN
ncbi:MAG: hypothetical protein Gaeavirus39_4 [Gaeavirus sp.]|uniref:Disease resistance R13L4/SHOC-2-like LRR domain-containing protein n=1 Tax=Gaeavirus sp. TaxID=2487767 RepID=A0A3G4ZZN4_9VIRU|nr:MAG: hypothetical protein Gaeavirus39_4 [Gaeavirus sp.]